MRINLIVWSLLLVSAFSMNAQEKFSAYMNVKTEPTKDIDFNETAIGVSFLKKIDAKNTITNRTTYTNLKLKYDPVGYESFESLNQFNRMESQFEFSHKVSNTTQWSMEVTPSVNFQKNPGASDVTLLGNFQIQKQLNLNTAIHIGVARTTIFGSPKFTPILSLYRKINSESDWLLGFPDSRISYSNNERNKFILSNSFNGSFYHLDHSADSFITAQKMATSQMTTALEYERNMDKNWFLNVKAGYDFDKSYRLLDENDHEVHDFSISNGYVLGIGIKYKQ